MLVGGIVFRFQDVYHGPEQLGCGPWFRRPPVIREILLFPREAHDCFHGGVEPCDVPAPLFQLFPGLADRRHEYPPFPEYCPLDEVVEHVVDNRARSVRPYHVCGCQLAPPSCVSPRLLDRPETPAEYLPLAGNGSAFPEEAWVCRVGKTLGPPSPSVPRHSGFWLVMVGLCPKGGFCRSSWVSIYQACSRLSAFSRPCRWCPGIALLVRPVWRGWPLRGLRGVQYVVRVVVDLSFLRIVGGIVPLAWAGCRHIDAVIHDSYCTGLWTVPPEIRACGMGGQRCGDRLHLHGGSSASATLSTPAVGLMTWSPCCRFMWRHPGLGRNQVRRFSSAGSFLSEEIARGSRENDLWNGSSRPTEPGVGVDPEFAPVPGRCGGSAARDRGAVRRSWSGRIPSPFSGRLLCWTAFGTPGVAGCRSGIGSRWEWRERPHSTQIPRSLAFSLLSCMLRRFSSLRSGVWDLWRSYSRRVSFLVSTSVDIGWARGFGALGWGAALGMAFFRLVGFCLALGFAAVFLRGAVDFLGFPSGLGTSKVKLSTNICLLGWTIPERQSHQERLRMCGSAEHAVHIQPIVLFPFCGERDHCLMAWNLSNPGLARYGLTVGTCPPLGFGPLQRGVSCR